MGQRERDQYLARAAEERGTPQRYVQRTLGASLPEHAARMSRLAELRQRDEGGNSVDEGGDSVAERAATAKAVRFNRGGDADGDIRAYFAGGGAGSVSDVLPVGEGRLRHRALFSESESDGDDAGSSDIGSELSERRRRTAARLTGRADSAGRWR